MNLLSLFVAAAIALLVHELGHYLAACALKIAVLRVDVGCGPVVAISTKQNAVVWAVRLLPLGGSVVYPGEIREAPLKYLGVLGAGPLANMLSGAVALWFVPDYLFVPNIPQMPVSWPAEFIGVFADISIAIGVFNLLPVPPLDGADIVAATISVVTGRRCSPIGQPAKTFGQILLAALTLGLAGWVAWIWAFASAIPPG